MDVASQIFEACNDYDTSDVQTHSSAGICSATMVSLQEMEDTDSCSDSSVHTALTLDCRDQQVYWVGYPIQCIEISCMERLPACALKLGLC